MSLFAERKLIELRMPTGKPGDAGAKALLAYAEKPVEDNVLLIVAGKLEAAQTKSKWYKALEKTGVVIQIWPIEIARLPQWIQQRLQVRGMRASAEAIKLLADRIEGNLLAADQEIEKLLLLHGAVEINAEQVVAAVSDSARFDVFSLFESALRGDAARASRILYGLQSEGVEALAVLGAMVYQVRNIIGMATAMQAGQSVDEVMAQYRVWDKQKAGIRAGLTRHSLYVWQAVLQRMGEIDRICKGMAAGRAWDELLQLLVGVAGVSLKGRAQVSA